MPGRGVAGSLVWHVLLLGLLIPLGRLAEPPPQFTLPQIQITWYGPTTDIAPPPAAKSTVAEKLAPRAAPKPDQPVVARAYNPKTAVIFQPPRPTNTRQVLIEPDAPPSLPKYLPSMANVISWVNSAPIQPEITVNPNALVARKPKHGSVPESMAPQIANDLLPVGPLDIAPPADATLQPPVPLAPSAIRAEQTKRSLKAAAAPKVAFTGSRLVAISLVPANVLPPTANASAPISIGPRVGKVVSSAAPDIAMAAAPGASGTPAAKGAMPGPAGLLILNEGAVPAPPPAPRAPAPAPRIAALSPLHVRPAAPAMRANLGSRTGGIVPHDLAHQVLGMRPIQTLLMDMPNLTSATGSWKLDFAELPGEKIPLGGDIVAPLPIRKVDPEYPPEQIQKGVEGDVVLYAVIGSDGTVSHIRVVQSLDPVLDRNAEDAFAKWLFQPALANNVPIDLEVLVHIPFRYQSPQP